MDPPSPEQSSGKDGRINHYNQVKNIITEIKRFTHLAVDFIKLL